MTSTHTPWAAREHARAQGNTVVDAMPTVPAHSWPDRPDGVDAHDLTWAEVLAGGSGAARTLSRGTHLRLRDVAGQACAHVLLFSAGQPWERLSVADTVKVPWQAYMSAGHPLLSDQGRVLATLVADSGGHHDALCAAGQANRATFINLAAKQGLEPRDLGPGVSFFKGVRVDADGALRFLGGSGAGASVTLRCELPVTVLIVNGAHPLDPAPDVWVLEILAWRGRATAPGDPLWSSTPELRRALENTAEYWEARR